MGDLEPVLAARGLSVASGRRTIVHPADFSLGPGEWKALVGPNGAGKSTFLKALALLAPFKGALFYRGKPVAEAAVAYRRRVGVVLHEPLVYAGLTARENLILYADLYGIDRASDAVSEQLEAVGLARFADEPVRRFSRGMLQRLAVARALLHGPELLLLDEPLTGIDDQGVREAIEIFAAAKRRGVAALWVTHRWDRAWDVVDEVVQMSGGRLRPGVRTSDVDRAAWTPDHVGSEGSGVDP